MKRRSKVNGKRAKAQGSKSTKPKRRRVPSRPTSPISSTAGEQGEGLNHIRELNEAREQLAASFEVLHAISSSHGELKPIFQSMLKNATRICEAKFGLLFLFNGGAFHLAAEVGTSAEFLELLRERDGLRPISDSHLDRVMRTKEVSHTADYAAEGIPSPPVTLGGARSTVGVPMLKDDQLVGAFFIYRQEVRPFSEKQIALVQNFAAQAVIAIENARLLNELRQALEQQTATSEVLKVISTTHGELEPAFQLMLEKATRLCNASFGNLLLMEGEDARVAAMHNAPSAFSELRRRTPVFRPPEWTRDPTNAYLHISDCVEEPAYKQRDTGAVAMVELAQARTLLNVPMTKDGQLMGYFALYRQEVRPFTDKQIELVQNFAAQAVIAIENARLLNELRQRTSDLTEALEQQTAASDVLRIISSSPGDLQPVFDILLANATRLCEASYGAMWLRDGDRLRKVALHGVLPEAYVEQTRARSVSLDTNLPMARAIRSRKPVQIDDLRELPAYIAGDPLPVASAEIAGIRTVVAVPMFRDNEPVGAIIIYRREVRPFSDKQIALVANFAAQAVIAIENARLLRELRERTDQSEAQSQELANLNQQLEQRVADQVGEIERMGKLRRFLPPR